MTDITHRVHFMFFRICYNVLSEPFLNSHTECLSFCIFDMTVPSYTSLTNVTIRTHHALIYVVSTQHASLLTGSGCSDLSNHFRDHLFAPETPNTLCTVSCCTGSTNLTTMFSIFYETGILWIEIQMNWLSSSHLLPASYHS